MFGIIVLVVILVLTASTASGWLSYRAGERAPVAIQVEKLQAMGHLTVLKAFMADVGSKDSSSWGSTSKVLVKLKGDAMIAVDMRKAEILSQNSVTKTMVLLLPKPEVLSPRVDHNSAQIYDQKSGWWAGKTAANLLDEAYRDAQHGFEVTAGSEEIIDQARENTKILVKQFYGMVGWEVEVKWSDQQHTVGLLP